MTTDIKQAYVHSETKNGITTVEFFHPQSNSLPSAILQDLALAITEAGKNRECRIILLRSGGPRAFCAGASFDELSVISTEEEGLRFFSGFALVINAMRTCGKFVIARIQGKCVGGGVGLAAAAEYSIAVTEADVKLSELAVGIGPFVVGPAIERKIGAGRFQTLAVDAATFRSSRWALEAGLFSELHDTAESMDQAVDKLSHFLAQSSPDAMAEMKKIFWKGTEHWDVLLQERAAISGRLVLGSHARNFIEAARSKK